MPITVARIPNLECEAFYFDMERRGIELRNMEPNTVAEALEQGDIDAGPVPLVDTFRLSPKATLISGFCVASAARAISSALHSKEPIEALSGSRIALGNGDAASAGLLRVLLTLKHGVGGETFVDEQSDHDATLLTGNQALRSRRRLRGFLHLYDLGEEWQTWTGLPFVFSRWMASAEMERRDFVVLEDALFVGQEDWLNKSLQGNPTPGRPAHASQGDTGIRFRDSGSSWECRRSGPSRCSRRSWPCWKMAQPEAMALCNVPLWD